MYFYFFQLGHIFKSISTCNEPQSLFLRLESGPQLHVEFIFNVKNYWKVFRFQLIALL